MNFSQLHERVRVEMLRRIENGSLSATLLAHQLDCSTAHVSNFLHRKRRLSLDALDKLLRAQLLSIADLLPDRRYFELGNDRNAASMSYDPVPLVEPWVAASHARIYSNLILDVVKLRSGTLGKLRDKCSAQRRRWDRFVAVQIPEEEAALMQPVLPRNAVVLIDRHYNSTFAYAPGRNNVYAVRLGNRLRFRYVGLAAGHMVLRTHDPVHQPELIALSAGQTSADLLVGRVFLMFVDP